jgi:hypothetical protein
MSRRDSVSEFSPDWGLRRPGIWLGGARRGVIYARDGKLLGGNSASKSWSPIQLR